MLPFSLRLSSHEIPFLLRSGTHKQLGNLELIYMKSQEHSRFSVIVPGKVYKQATKRNRSRRIIREAIMATTDSLPYPVNAVIIVRGRDSSNVRKASELLRKLFSSV